MLDSFQKDDKNLETNIPEIVQSTEETEKLFVENLKQKEITLLQQIDEKELKLEGKKQFIEHVPLKKKYSITHSISATNLIPESPINSISPFSASFSCYEATKSQDNGNNAEGFEEFREPLTSISPSLNLDESNFFGSGLIAENESSVETFVSEESALQVFRPTKKIRKLRFGIVQLRNFAMDVLNQQHLATSDLASIQLSIQVRIDSEEIFTSAAVPASPK